MTPEASPRPAGRPANQPDARRRERGTLALALAAGDLVAILAAVVATDLAREWLARFHYATPMEADRYLVASLLVPPVLLVLFRLQGLYDLDNILVGTREYGRIAHAVTYGILIAVGVSYFLGGSPIISRLWLVLVWVFTIVAVGSWRFAGRRIVRRLRRRGLLHTRVVIVGASMHGVAIAEQLIAARNEGLDVLGFLDEYVPVGQKLLGEIAVLGRPEGLVRGGWRDLADEYILVPQALPAERLDQIARLMVTSGGPTLRMAVSSRDLLTNGVLITERANVPLVRLRQAQIAGADAALKRGLDLLGASVGLLVLGPPALAAILWRYIGGARPLFKRYKISGAGDQALTAVILLDRRVTTALPLRGAPALLAVLRGHLSLVGPRPISVDSDLHPTDSRRLVAAKPGLTGPWRLSGAHATLADQATRDLFYVRNYNIWEDLRIIWASIRLLGEQPESTRIIRWQGSGGLDQAPGYAPRTGSAR